MAKYRDIIPKPGEKVPFNIDDTPNISGRLSRLVLPERIIKPQESMLIGGQAKFVSITLPGLDRLELLHLTDVQWANPQCNKPKLYEYIDWVLENENRYLLLGGDIGDYNTMLSVGRGAMDQEADPDEQIFKLAEVLAPVSHRILGYVGGNHERRGQKAGTDFGKHLAYALRIPYSSGVQHISLYFGDWKPFKIYLWHGRGAARTKGAKAQMMWSVVGNDKANLYVSGHIHDALVLPGVHVDRSKDTMILEKFYCVSSTSFLNYYGTYAEEAFYPVTFLLMGCCVIYPNGTFRVSI